MKLRRLDEITHHKRNLAKIYFTELKGKFILPDQNTDFEDVFHIFNIRHPERERLREFLLGKGIKTEIHYPIPPHHQKALESLFRGQSFPISEEIHQTTLSLPISFMHQEKDIFAVCQALKSF